MKIAALLLGITFASCSELGRSCASASKNSNLEAMSSNELDIYLNNLDSRPSHFQSAFANVTRFFRGSNSSSKTWSYKSPPNDPEIMQQHNLIGYLECVARQNDPNQHIPVLMKHILDWKMTRYSTNSSVLSTINSYFREKYLGSLKNADYLHLFKPFYSNSRLYINDFVAYLYALALFTVDIQKEIVQIYMVNFPKYKNSLLHYAIIYGLSEETINFMIASGAQIHVEPEHGLSYNNQYDSSNLFLSFREFKTCIEGGNFNDPSGPGEAFVRGMYNSMSDKFRSGSLRNSFYFYSPELTIKLIEIAPDQKLAKLHLAQLLSAAPSKQPLYPKIEELVDPNMLISRLRQGIPDAIAITMLSQRSDNLEETLDIISEFHSKTTQIPSDSEQKSIWIKFSWTEYEEPIFDTSVEFQNQFGFKAIPLSYFSDIIFIAKINNLHPDAFDLLSSGCSDRYIENVIKYGHQSNNNDEV